MKNDVIVTLKQMQEDYRKYKKNALTREWYLYYSGAVNALSRAIKILSS